MLPRLRYLVLGLLAGCTVYPGGHAPLAPSGTSARPTTYQTVAILPIRVAEVRLRGFTNPGQPDTTGATRLRAGRRCEKLAYQLQLALAAQLRARQPTTNYAVWLQATRETNLRLQRAGVTYQNLPDQSAAHLQEVLGVDALLMGQTTLSTLPLSVKLAAGLLPSQLGQLPTTLASTSLTLQDPRREQPTWQASFSSSEPGQFVPGSFAELATQLVQALPPTFPYR